MSDVAPVSETRRIKSLDVESLSPLEALNLLYELKRDATS